MQRPTILCRLLVCMAIAAAMVESPAIADQTPSITFQQQPGKLQISIGGKPFSTYVYRDENILRPYFTNVHAPGGIQVTRRHPPRKGIDSTDHASMHPGIWLAFGDISGADFWRNRAQVEHVEFIEMPRVENHTGTFEVRNRYRDGEKLICEERCRHTISVRDSGYLLVYDSTFSNRENLFIFGDQEEMGLGVRVASELRVTGGNGIILNSDGLKNEQQVRGKQADWCDYSGTINGEHVGMVLLPDPQNFRRSWYHARNYGFVTANPFGRNALTGGPKSKVIVKPEESFRLQFGILVYTANGKNRVDLKAAYQNFMQQIDRLSK